MSNSRYSVSIDSVAVEQGAANSDLIDYGDFTSGMIYMPTGSPITTLNWYACTTKDGEIASAMDSSGLAVAQTVGDGAAYPIPEALSGCRYIIAVGDVAGTIGLTLKN
jgi:hypothetical protein